MHFPTLTSVLAFGLLATPATARIVAIKAPASVTAGAGKTAKITVQTENYIQNNADYSIVWGYRPNGNQCDTCLGTLAGFTDLVSTGHSSTAHGTFTATISAPGTAGTYNLTAAVTSTAGASESVSLREFYVTVTAH